MRALALGLTTLLAVSLGACADKATPAKAHADIGALETAKEAPPAETMAKAVEPIGPMPTDAVTDAEGSRADAGEDGLEAAAQAPVDAARDAKEATEAAARKIFDATRSAALKLKEAGREAVESVRSEDSPQGAEQPAATVAD